MVLFFQIKCLFKTKSIIAKPSLSCDVVCVVRAQHPLAKKKLPTKQDYLQYSHLYTAYHENLDNYRNAHAHLEKRHKNIHIKLSLDNRMALPEIIQSPKMIATTSEFYASYIAKRYKLHCFPCPIAFAKIHIKIYQHKRTEGVAEIAWLIETLSEFMEQVRF